MQYGVVPGVALPVSRLVQGTMMIGMDNLDASFALLDGVWALGCNAFDCAHVYGGGNCERALGEWMRARGLRDKVVAITKGAHFNADRPRVTPFDIASDLHDSLARLKTDYIDLYLLHRDDPGVPVGPIVEALAEHLRAGRIRAFGGSNWTHARIREANEYAARHGLTPFAASSPHFSLAEQVAAPWPGCVTITGAANRDARAWYAAQRMPVFAWSSLSGGFLSGRFSRADIEAYPQDAEELFVRCYRSESNLARLERAQHMARDKGCGVSELALAYALDRDLDLFALVGCLTADEFAANARAFDVRLSREESAWLEAG